MTSYLLSLGAVITFLLANVSCQMQPTKVSSKRVRPEFEQLVAKSEKPIVLSELSVVLDVRSHFDYGLNHVVNSYHFPWSNLAEFESTGELLKDTSKASLRLALMGLTPATHVVIVGYGQAGQGEEGRLAWNLLYLGFVDVQTAAIETFRKQMTQEAPPPAQNVPMWKASPHENMLIAKPDFLAQARDPKGRLRTKTHILDVRSEKEYIKSKHPDFQALNIEWKQFFTAKGRPDPKLRDKLVALGILPSHRVIVISQKGVRSSAASYALVALGYERVQNFVDGFSSL